MIYPTNYDFGAKWQTEIVPLLDTKEIKSAIRKGVNDYLKIMRELNPPSGEDEGGDDGERLNESLKTPKKYMKNTAPANYSFAGINTNTYFLLLMRRKNRRFRKLRKNKLLPVDYLNAEKAYLTKEKELDKFFKNDDLDNIPAQDSDELMDLQHAKFELRHIILDPYFTWDKIRYRIETYYLCGGSHWMAPTFWLLLAQVVEPNEAWEVRSGDIHTTIINKDRTRVFDLDYWCGTNNRIHYYVFGDTLTNGEPDIIGGYKTWMEKSPRAWVYTNGITQDDPTLGGKQAFIDSYPA